MVKVDNRQTYRQDKNYPIDHSIQGHKNILCTRIDFQKQFKEQH